MTATFHELVRRLFGNGTEGKEDLHPEVKGVLGCIPYIWAAGHQSAIKGGVSIPVNGSHERQHFEP